MPYMALEQFYFGCVISCLNKTFKDFYILNAEICIVGGTLIIIGWMVLWVSSAVCYSSCMSSEAEYAGFTTQKNFTDTIKKYNNKYDRKKTGIN